jgi:actin-related protein
MLYQNIALSGGSTLFSGFNKRLSKAIQKRVNDRLDKYEKESKTKVIC